MTLIELPDERAAALKVARPLDLAKSGGSLFLLLSLAWEACRHSTGSAME